MTTPIDEYLVGVSEPERTALERLRQTIRSVVPEATEVISYQIPTFRYRGRMLVGFNATKEGCTFHLMSNTVLAAQSAEVERYSTGKGSVRFAADQPLPDALVIRLVKARIAENEQRSRKPTD